MIERIIKIIETHGLWQDSSGRWYKGHNPYEKCGFPGTSYHEIGDYEIEKYGLSGPYTEEDLLSAFEEGKK